MRPCTPRRRGLRPNPPLLLNVVFRACKGGDASALLKRCVQVALQQLAAGRLRFYLLGVEYLRETA